jgi:hypothetical protein
VEWRTHPAGDRQHPPHLLAAATRPARPARHARSASAGRGPANQIPRYLSGQAGSASRRGPAGGWPASCCSRRGRATAEAFGRASR